MTIQEKIKQTEQDLSKTKSPYARKDLQKHLYRLKKQLKGGAEWAKAK